MKALATGVHTTETVQLGRVGGGHVIPVTDGKLEEKKQPLITMATFRKIEVDTEMARNSLMKLKRILIKEIPVEKGVKEGLRSWDKL